MFCFLVISTENTSAVGGDGSNFQTRACPEHERVNMISFCIYIYIYTCKCRYTYIYIHTYPLIALFDDIADNLERMQQLNGSAEPVTWLILSVPVSIIDA